MGVTATALDSVSREQILRRLNKLEFPGCHLRIDVSQAPELDFGQEAFFFKATFENGRLTVHGRLSERKTSERLASILATDLPGIIIENELEITSSLTTPNWSRRLPNLLSLVCTRTDGARISTNGTDLRIIAEMKPDQAPEDLADILSLMTGPAVSLETRLLPFEEEISKSPKAKPSPADPAPEDGKSSRPSTNPSNKNPSSAQKAGPTNSPAKEN